MTREEFRAAAFAHALELGCDAAETYFAENDAFTVDAQGGAIERYDVARQAGLSLRVQVNGRDGYAYTEVLDDPERLVARAMDNAAAIETSDEHPMQGRCAYAAVKKRKNALGKKTEAEKIALALEMERTALAADSRVQRVMYCQVATESGHIEIHNTQGLCAARDASLGYCYVMPTLRQGAEVKTGFAYRMGAEAADAAGCAREAVSQGAQKFGAGPVASGDYRVLLGNEATGDLLSAFLPVFSADEAQKGCSLLAGKEGQRIGAAIVSIVDDPFHPAAPRAFDGEGTPCRKKAVVEKGVLQTLLHNLKTARKAGCASTGNAVRASAASPVGVGPTVFYLRPGRRDPAAMRALLGTGLYITELGGTHAGVDAVSGDFSLEAEGFLVENGEIARPVSQITVAGNFLALLHDALAVGSDLKFPMGGGGAASPSLLIRRLAVAGE